MKKLNNELLLFLVAVLLLFASGVVGAGLFGDDNIVWTKNANVYVKYGDRDSNRFGENHHPVQLNEEQVRTVLRSLKIQDDEGGSVFTEQQADVLGGQLTKALKNAKPTQDVLFALDRESPRPVGLKPGIYFLAGRAFYKDDRLNIILGEYDKPRNAAYEKAYDPTGMGIARYAFRHGERSESSGAFDSQLLASNGVEQKRLVDSLRRDWFVIDVDTAMAGISQQAEKREVRAAGVEDSPRQREASPAVHPAPPSSLHPVEERLIILKRLRDRGLITEEEYTNKRKETIDEF